MAIDAKKYTTTLAIIGDTVMDIWLEENPGKEYYDLTPKVLKEWLRNKRSPWAYGTEPSKQSGDESSSIRTVDGNKIRKQSLLERETIAQERIADSTEEIIGSIVNLGSKLIHHAQATLNITKEAVNNNTKKYIPVTPKEAEMFIVSGVGLYIEKE